MKIDNEEISMVLMQDGWHECVPGTARVEITELPVASSLDIGGRIPPTAAIVFDEPYTVFPDGPGTIDNPKEGEQHSRTVVAPIAAVQGMRLR